MFKFYKKQAIAFLLYPKASALMILFG